MKKQTSKQTDTKTHTESPDGLNSYKNQYFRALADYQNLVRRTQEERQTMSQDANKYLIMQLLPIVDDLERACLHASDNEALQMIMQKIVKLLAGQGVEKIRIRNDETYDPHTMECIEADPGGQRLVEIESGYLLNGRLLRPVKVKLVKDNTKEDLPIESKEK